MSTTATLLSEPHSEPTPEGLTPGRWIRIASVGPVYDRFSGKQLATFTEPVLRTFAEYVTRQSHDAPVLIDMDHDGVPRGEIVAARYVDDERGPGLEVAPAYNAAGLAEIERHGGVLWTSPMFANGGFDKSTGERVAGAVLAMVSLTAKPRSPASGLDRVRLAEITPEAGIEPEEADAMEERIAELEAQLEAAQTENAVLKAEAAASGPDEAEMAEAAEAAAVELSEVTKLAETRGGELDALRTRLSEVEARADESDFHAAYIALQAAGHTALAEPTARKAWDARKAGHDIAWTMLSEAAVPTPGDAPLGATIGHGATSEPKTIATQLAEATDKRAFLAELQTSNTSGLRAMTAPGGN
jgi:BMFP domain-containing protein YqiC